MLQQFFLGRTSATPRVVYVLFQNGESIYSTIERDIIRGRILGHSIKGFLRSHQFLVRIVPIGDAE